MAEPTSFEELGQAIGNVLNVETTNFFELAEMLGLDPKQDFAGADLSGTDFFKGNLAGANFAETDLRGANFAYANLQGANLTNAQLGVLPSNYQAHTDELDYGVFRAHNLAIDLIRTITFTIARTRTRSIACSIAIAIAIVLDRGRGYDFALIHVIHVISIVIASTLTIAIVNDLIRNLTSIFDRYRYPIFSAMGGGANFTGANLTGARLDGATVEGTVMTSCKGLSSSEITDLKRRGAIFDSSPGDRSEVHVPVPR